MFISARAIRSLATTINIKRLPFDAKLNDAYKCRLMSIRQRDTLDRMNDAAMQGLDVLNHAPEIPQTVEVS